MARQLLGCTLECMLGKPQPTSPAHLLPLTRPPCLPRLLPPAAESMDQHMLLAPAAWLQPHRCAAPAQTALYCCVHARLLSLLERCSSPGYVLLLLLLLLLLRWPGGLACRAHAAAATPLQPLLFRCCATPACLPACRGGQRCRHCSRHHTRGQAGSGAHCWNANYSRLLPLHNHKVPSGQGRACCCCCCCCCCCLSIRLHCCTAHTSLAACPSDNATGAQAAARTGHPTAAAAA